MRTDQPPNVCTTSVMEGEVARVKLVEAPSNSLLTVPRQWFWCGLCELFWCQSVGDVSIYVFFILLVQFGLLSGHLLGNSCPLG